MADCGETRTEVMNSKQKQKRKRKLKESVAEEALRPFKTPHLVDAPKEVEAPAEEVGVVDQEVERGKSHPWTNLQLILSLQSKELDVQKKLELAFNFVKARAEGGSHDDGRDYETVKLSRLIVFLNDWIQSLLISSGKKIKVGQKSDSDVVPSYLDLRCWEIFRFCLEKASVLMIALNFSRNLLQPICLVARHPMLRLNDVFPVLKEAILNKEEFELYGIVSDCISLLFSSHEGMSNENLDLWISTIDAVVELVNKVLVEKLEGGKDGVLVLRFSCIVLEPFAKFLRVHPMRKGGFADFVDKLLEPLLELLGVMHVHTDESDRRSPCYLLKLVEEIISNGLFHPIHIDGFLTLRSTDKYLALTDGKPKASTTVIKSYHRHLFDQLERITDAKKFMALNGMGKLFHQLADRVKKQTTKAMLPECVKASINTKDSIQLEDEARAEKSYRLVNLNAETRKSLFDFFVQITEPLLLKLNCHLEDQMEGGDLEEIHSELSCLRTILFSFTCEKVYIKTEDISGGACLGFLKKVYDTLISLCIRLNQDWSSKHDALVRSKVEILPALAEKAIALLGCLLEIEYEVVGSDLIMVWSIIISFLALGISLSESIHRSLLLRKILNLGCQLVNLYSELRQVNSITFALCQALRLLKLSDAGESSLELAPGCSISSCGDYVKSVGTLLCSQEFKLVLCNAISSIPEGQASGCIQQLAEDVSETLMWLKLERSKLEGEGSDKLNSRGHGMLFINLQCEVLCRGLSEVYSLVLDSLTVTRSNSTLVGSSMKGLMAVIRPHLSTLVGLPSQSINEFVLSLTGCPLGANHEMTTHWALMFFFSLYMSCRSLFRQIISLMPPDSAKKMSAWIGDLLTANAGKYLIERTDWTDEGYFSWIVNPSASLLDVIQSISDVYLQSNVADCSCLIYQLHAMAFQRLVDLNRKIKSAEYLLQSTDMKLQSQVLDGAAQSVHHKKCRKWQKSISKLNKEAAGLTEFIMQYLTLLADGLSFSADCGVGFNSRSPYESDKWDLSVSSVNRRSLPVALWWIICQNIDVWCSHAAKKKLKMFLSLLIHSSLSSTAEGPADVNHKKMTQPPVVTVQQISFELLYDSTLYEHRFVRRHLPSSFCKILENSAGTLLPHSTSPDFDICVSPNWAELLEALEKSLDNSKGKQSGIHVRELASSFQLSVDNQSEGVFHVTGRKFAVSQKLLRFLCWMPKGYLDSRSLKLYVTYVLYIERLAVSSMLNYRGNSKSCDYYQLFKLFLCCRKALKNLLDASCDENTGAGLFSFSPVLSLGSFPFQWLFKSAYLVLGLQDAQANGGSNLYVDTAFSLMDYTSYIFLVSSKYYFARTHDTLLDVKVPGTETDSDEDDTNCNSIQSDSYADPSDNGEAWKSMFIIAESIKKEIQGLLGSREDFVDNSMVNLGHKHSYLSKLAYLASCLSGCLWGLASALSHIDVKDGDSKVTLLKRKKDLLSKLNTFLEIYADVVRVQFRMLLDQRDKMVDYVELSGVKKFSLNNCNSVKDVCEHRRRVKGVVRTCLESPGFVSDSSIANNIHTHGSEIESGGSVPSSAAEVHSIDLQILNKHFLRWIINGDELEAAVLLRHLLIGYSALLKLNVQVGTDCLSTNVLHVFMEVAQFLILDLANSFEVPESYIFVSLDGVLKFLEELGSHFPLTDPELSRNAYTRIIELHLMAIGKCISLQGKKYNLISHEMESSTKILRNHRASDESSYSHSSFCLDEFKARLRMSFEVYIRKSSELHLLSAVQAVERALVGIQVGSAANYDVNVGKAGGGRLSSYVAAGIDCLDLLLENVTGRKRLNVVRRHIQSLIAGLLNIILHLQGPLIFCKRSIESSSNNDPDSGAVILMCIEVLARVSGKHALFQMDSWHVSQSLHIPAALFQEFSQLWLHRAPAASGLISTMPNLEINLEANIHYRFSVDMYAACCRLLYTVLKHHKSESEKCVAQLQESVSVLLHVLETVDRDSISRKNCFLWEVQEGIKCACSLRRIYEEMRQQKDVFGPHCFKLLASYISVYSGFGPLKSGIIREIDEALRPGIYALLDACSADDLQYLHTVFGEGPCRSTLARLQHDYTLNFQYEGKV